MRHKKIKFKLNRTSAHRRAMMSNMAVSLVTHGKIKTTVPKAKLLRPFFESLITIAKRKDRLIALRMLTAKMKNIDSAHKIMDEVMPKFKDRQGGYLRIIRIGYRKGDDAEIAQIALIS
ncbi:50S ribosomal subunit protein L17 [Candidatus Xenohaliotis californiensis]|uniref:50S ribosomal protein L17 n=1 Tax=Candidatus Xenohaliotis californiensis TaxID=84677 RepID=A0ABP0ETB6_9RICK|nr:50S ribosomal subunit protein L17 [Candidatus Xenohaliotis californiensis]